MRIQNKIGDTAQNWMYIVVLTMAQQVGEHLRGLSMPLLSSGNNDGFGSRYRLALFLCTATLASLVSSLASVAYAQGAGAPAAEVNGCMLTRYGYVTYARGVRRKA